MGVNRHNTHALRRAFGAVLREAREAAGLSQEELALRDDFHPTYPSMLERGLRMPTLGALKDLGAVLNLPPAQLVADALARERSLRDGSPRNGSPGAAPPSARSGATDAVGAVDGSSNMTPATPVPSSQCPHALGPRATGRATLGSTEEATGPRLNTLSREITPAS